MYLRIVCLNELNRNCFYLLPLRLLLLPLIRYLTRSLCSLVRYRVEHSQRNSISPRAHVLLFT